MEFKRNSGIHSSKHFIEAYLNKKEEIRELLSLSYKEAKIRAKSFIKYSPLTEVYKINFSNRDIKAIPIPKNRKPFLEKLKEESFKLGVMTNFSKCSLDIDLRKE